MSNDFELVLSVNETDMKTIKNALNRAYQQGRTDLLMPYDVKSIEELVYNVRRRARADAVEEAERGLIALKNRGYKRYSIDDELQMLEKIKDRQIAGDYRLSKESLISAIRSGESIVNPNDNEYDRGFHNGLEWMFYYITGETPNYVRESKEANEQAQKTGNCSIEVTDDYIQMNYSDGKAKIILSKEAFTEAFDRYIGNKAVKEVANDNG